VEPRVTGPLLALALAATRVVLPPWPLSPDGDAVAVTSGDALEADGASVARVAPGLFMVTPAPGARTVALRAGSERAVAEVEPPPGEIAISASPAAPVKGRDAEVALDLLVRRADGAIDEAAAPPVLTASCGAVRNVAPSGPGRFRAVYVPAPTTAPDVAVLVALSPRCPLCPTPRAIGTAVLPLASAIELPGRAQPGTRTTISVGRRKFGPVRAGKTGRFSVPIVVPPGRRFVTAEAVDRAGNRTSASVDLRLPDVDRLACVAWPPALPADGESGAEIWCAGADPRGRPLPARDAVLSAQRGALFRGVPFRDHLLRVPYRPPRGGAGAEAVSVILPEAGATVVALILATGAPERIAAALARDPVPFGATVAAQATVLDARGDVVGRAVGPPGAEEGFISADRFVARSSAHGDRQEAPVSFALAPGKDAATLTLRREGRSWVATARTVDGRPAAGVALRFGSGADARTDARGEARAPARGAAESVVGPGGVRAAGWEGIHSPEAPFEIERKIEVRLRPAAGALVDAGR
jgi:hypothetical protein